MSFILTQGAERLYDMLVKPHLKKYEATIDENCDRLLRQTTATAGSYFKAASDVVRARVIDAVSTYHPSCRLLHWHKPALAGYP